MHFIKLELDTGREVFINMEKVVRIDELATGATRLFYDFEVFGEHAYSDVAESASEILAKC